MIAEEECHESFGITVTKVVNREGKDKLSLGFCTIGSLPEMPSWAQEWLNDKAAQGLSPGSLQRYKRDLEVLDLDLSKASLVEIKARLAACSTHYGRGSLRHLCICAKQILKQLGRESEAKLIRLPKHPEPRVVIYSPEEVERLINSCRILRDRLLIEILSETGARRGELFNMKMKDVRFDEYSAIVWLHGKTGTRSIRVYGHMNDFLSYLISHPNRENPEAPFWVNNSGGKLGYHGIYKIVRRSGRKYLHRLIYPHGFRHTAATRDAKKFTDQEMMIRYGWNRPEMVQVYAHLTGRDVDEKDLALHGFKSGTVTEHRVIELQPFNSSKMRLLKNVAAK